MINAGRGRQQVAEDIVAALDEGALHAATLDVFATEPTTEPPLFGLDSAVAPPHPGARPREAPHTAGDAIAAHVEPAG